jgi:tetratricopeptide (TPR) repeat protein
MTYELTRAAIAVLGLTIAVACGGAPQSGSDSAASAPSGARLVARGKLFARGGDLTRAGQYFDAALAEGASPEQVVPLLMWVYVHSRRYRMAIDCGEQYLATHPGDHRMRYLLGTLHAAVGDPDHAVAELGRLLELVPRHALGHYALAVLLRDTQGDPAGARRHFERYLEILPNGAHADEARSSTAELEP